MQASEEVGLGTLVARRIDAVLTRWHDEISERAGASIHRLPSILVAQPVVNAAYVS